MASSPPPCRKDRGGVNLQELRGVDGPVILFWQVGLELARPDHHMQMWRQRHAPPPPVTPGELGGYASRADGLLRDGA
jgi:hypothetical protein